MESRRSWIGRTLTTGIGLVASDMLGDGGSKHGNQAHAARYEAATETAITKGLRWLDQTQSRVGHWTDGTYPTAMTALAGTAMLSAGSTATQGPYASNIRLAVDYLIAQANPNGLIGDPQRDSRYTYGHGFSMLFLSQVLGEEEDVDRRDELIGVLKRAVDFSGFAQTPSGGWGYVSAKEGNNFDEGSTTITQVQGLRGCRNAGIPVSNEVIENAKKYIYSCKNADGGISYSSKNRGTLAPSHNGRRVGRAYSTQGTTIVVMCPK